MFLIFICTGYSTVGCRKGDSDPQREKRSTVHAQVWLPRSGHYGLRNGQEPPKFGSQGYRLESHNRKGMLLKHIYCYTPLNDSGMHPFIHTTGHLITDIQNRIMDILRGQLK